MKNLLLVIFTLLLFSNASNGQVLENDTVKVDQPVVLYDTITNTPIELEEVYVTNQYNLKSAEERKRFLILQRRVIKVYPFAKAAAERLSALNEGMKGLKSAKDKRKYFKLVEDYLTNEFESQLKKLSRKDGQILVKLIHRQTGFSTFELIKDLKSGWKAFWSNNTAKLFDINLKTKYDVYIISEDFIIEGILYRAFNDRRLVKQPAKVSMNYADLVKIWRSRLNETANQKK